MAAFFRNRATGSGGLKLYIVVVLLGISVIAHLVIRLNHKSEVNEMQLEVDRLLRVKNEEINEKDEQLNTLRESLEGSRNSLEMQNKNFEEELTKVNKEHQLTKNYVVKLKLSLEEEGQKVKKLHEREKELQEQLQEATKSSTTSETAFKEVTKNNAALREEVESLSSKLSFAHERISELESLNNQLEEDLTDAKTKTNENLDKVSRISTEFLNHKKEFNEKGFNSLKNKVEELEEKEAKTLFDLSRCQAQVETLTQNCDKAPPKPSLKQPPQEKNNKEISPTKQPKDQKLSPVNRKELDKELLSNPNAKNDVNKPEQPQNLDPLIKKYIDETNKVRDAEDFADDFDQEDDEGEYIEDEEDEEQEGTNSTL